MRIVVTAVQWMQWFAFTCLAMITLRIWRRHRSAAAAWAAGTFASLAFITAAILIAGASLSELPDWMIQILISVVLLFPYSLYRFAATFVHPPGWAGKFAAGITAGMILSTWSLPRFPAPTEPRPAWMQAFVFGLMIDWTALSLPVSMLLWRSGRRQPMLPRRRMRLLGAAAFGLNISVIVSAMVGSEQSAAMDITAALIAVVCAVLFYLALAPPGPLRVWWRRHEEASLQRAAIGVSGATTLEEVTAVLLPHIATMFGAHGAVLIGREHGPIGAHGMDPGETETIDKQLRDREAPRVETGLLVIPLRNGWLAVKASAYTPFFGREEVELLRSVGAFVDLAIDRAALFASERQARAEIERANDELEAFTYSVSHDLKSPLVALSGYIDYLEEDFGDAIGPDGKQYLARMTTNAAYMENLIQDLLELSRVGRLQTEESEVDLGSVVRGIVLEVLSSHRGASIEVGSLPIVWMNQVRARQLFTNLVENAIDHAGREDVHVRVSAMQDEAGWVEISVADDGQGIPADYRERVFRVFERLEPEDSKGTGIGLSICEKIVGRLGGRIWVADTGRGTDIRLTIPSHAMRGWHMEVPA